jgi:hypothetical protein
MTEGKGIVFLQKDKFDFYSPGLIKIIEFKFVAEFIHDLEVINSELLTDLIKLFVTNNKVQPTELLIILADNACFIKDFNSPSPVAQQQAASAPNQAPVSAAPVALTHTASEKMQEDIKSFIDHVPFENVLSRNFPMQNGTKVVAVNKDFYEAIKGAFEKAGFKVSAVYPGVIFENNIGSKPNMDIITANNILQKADYLRENNLLKEYVEYHQAIEKENKGEEKENDFTVNETEDKPGKTNKKRLFLMIGIFVILLVILVVVYMGSLQQTP